MLGDLCFVTTTPSSPGCLRKVKGPYCCDQRAETVSTSALCVTFKKCKTGINIYRLFVCALASRSEVCCLESECTSEDNGNNLAKTKQTKTTKSRNSHNAQKV